MLFYGYGPQLMAGLLLTLELALCALLFAFILGLALALARLSGRVPLVVLSLAYTSVVRGIPDMVTMMLLFYGAQIACNQVTEAYGLAQLTIDPFAAGVMALGLIYGAYFSETLRGALRSIPLGPMEAAFSFGMKPGQVFVRVQFPQMMRLALPGIANNWKVLLKSTALVSIIGLNDLVGVANQAGLASTKLFFFVSLAGALYLGISALSGQLLGKLVRHYDAGWRKEAT